MSNRSIRLLVAVATALACQPAAPAAPKPKEKGPTEAELKAFAAQVATALIDKDIDGLVAMCDAPFHRPGGYMSKDKDEFRQWITKALNNGQYRAEVNEVKQIETFEAAKSRFSATEVASMARVLAAGDFVVYVEMEQLGDRREEKPMLIKVQDGKPRLVGWGISPSRKSR